MEFGSQGTSGFVATSFGRLTRLSSWLWQKAVGRALNELLFLALASMRLDPIMVTTSCPQSHDILDEGLCLIFLHEAILQELCVVERRRVHVAR